MTKEEWRAGGPPSPQRLVRRGPLGGGAAWDLIARLNTIPSEDWSSIARWISCDGVWLFGIGKPPLAVSSARRLASSSAEMRMLASPLLRSMRTGSPVLRMASPPPAAASGEALRIDGEPEVPDWRPSPMQGSDMMPFFSSAAGGCMFTPSQEPG